MKAITIDDYGLDHVALRDVPEPEPGPHEVLVRVEAASLNHLDLWTLEGTLGIKHEFPHVLGADGAGEIEAVGPDVATGLKPGASVLLNPAHSCGACELCRSGEQSMCTTFAMLGEHRPGTLAEKVVVSGRNVFPRPEHLGAAESAALGVTFITAYRMLFTRGRMRPGEWVLITGIGGGLAQSLLQLARPLAGKVIVTSSSQAKLDRAVEMGADEVIDYTEEDVGRAVRARTSKRGVDLVLDSAGGESLSTALRAVRKGGRIVVAGATAGPKSEIDVRRLFWNQLEITGSTMGSDRDVADMLRHVAGTELRPLIDRTYPLEDGAEAVRALAAGEHFGKLAVEIS